MIGDFDQLPPVMDLPLYTTMSHTDLSGLGSTTYHTCLCIQQCLILICQI